MTRLLYLLFSFLPISIAYAQNTQNPPVTAYNAPAGIATVVLFFVLFFGSIIFFGFWVWHKNKKPRQDQ